MRMTKTRYNLKLFGKIVPLASIAIVYYTMVLCLVVVLLNIVFSFKYDVF